MNKPKFQAGERVKLVSMGDETAAGKLQIGDVGTTEEASTAPYVKWDREGCGARGVWAVLEEELEADDSEAKKKGEG